MDHFILAVPAIPAVERAGATVAATLRYVEARYGTDGQEDNEWYYHYIYNQDKNLGLKTLITGNIWDYCMGRESYHRETAGWDLCEPSVMDGDTERIRREYS